MSFYLSVKSSIDRVAFDIGTLLGVSKVVELDDTVNIDEALASPESMVVYQLLSLDEEPLDPLWSVNFDIGVKTVSDAANYDMADLMGKVHQVLFKDHSFYVKDYSGVDAPTEVEGYIYVTDMTVDPQAFDGAAGIRMWSVQGRAVRSVS